MVGAGAQGYSFVQRMERQKLGTGNEVVGFVAIPGENNVKDINRPIYDIEDMETVVQRRQIEEIIVVPSRGNEGDLLRVVDSLYPLNIPIKITPDRNNILLSKTRMTSFYGDPLVDVSISSMSESQKNIKRVIDVATSLLLLLALSPVYAVIALMIKINSKGPVIYRQERVGYHNKPFIIYKFRSMIDNAEGGGTPQLSSETDPRITPVGRFLRKYRLDELPQFYNVLKGDMSLVGPRPERRYYVDQLVKYRPAYSLVHRVRPGITSMGQVKFGYAENLEEMIERLDYDLLYLDNMSVLTDLKILVYTMKIVFTGKGV
ncbi:MAG: sugar transferase [Muribaculaceae bacterium]|nr:sugar transferase [Muribaculaceae bacterium]